MRVILVACAFACLLVCGCSIHKPYLSQAEFAPPIATAMLQAAKLEGGDLEVSYSRAVELDKANDERCLAEYLKCCRYLWPIVAQEIQSGCDSRHRELYQASVGKVVEIAQRHGKLNWEHGVEVGNSAIGNLNVPIRLHGTNWHPTELRGLITVGDYFVSKEVSPKCQNGLGTPVVIRRESSRPFIIQSGVLSATILIRPNEYGTMVVDVFDPLHVRNCLSLGQILPLAFDLTAPLAIETQEHQGEWLAGFLRPGTKPESARGLQMIEPYQPGKIPVVFVHGLASDPQTWAAMTNELNMHPEILQRYQFWIFSYPTGTPFPRQAAKLRRQLVELRTQVDPDHQDSALDNMVMVGHSMGGLMAKLQITRSGDRLREALALTPIEELPLPAEVKKQMYDALFFEPSQQIRRVVFIGTPHRGSLLASLPAGRMASRMITRPAEVTDDLKRMLKSPGGLPFKRSRMSTSVDLLVRDNPLLKCIHDLPIDSRVSLHSIIGVGHGGILREQTDGIVQLSSARHHGTESELLVDASHFLHNHPDSIAEVKRILNLHAEESLPRIQMATHNRLTTSHRERNRNEKN